LIVYGMVSVGHLRVAADTGANQLMLWAAILLNAALFVLLFGYTVYTGPASTWIALVAMFGLSFVAEWGFRRATGRRLRAPGGGTPMEDPAGVAAARE
jgi:hypothetical protein